MHDGRRHAGVRRRIVGRRPSSYVLLAVPVFVVALLFVVFCARVASGRIDVDAAASAAARAASMSPTVAAAAAAANSTAADTLAGQSIICSDLSVPVDTSQFRRGGSVSVTVVCTVQLADLGLIGIGGSRTLSSTATAPRRPLSPHFVWFYGLRIAIAGELECWCRHETCESHGPRNWWMRGC